MKQLTKAQLEAHQYRDNLHKGYTKYQDKNSTAVAYVGENSIGYHVAIMYKGRAKKSSRWHRFSTIKQLQHSVNDFFTRTAENESYTKSRSVRDLEVGDILNTCWGYDQTNVEFYQVTKLIGKTMVEVREIEQDVHYTQGYNGKCSPMVDKFTGEPLRRRARGTSVSINSHIIAGKMKPDSVDSNGVKVYGFKGFSTGH